MPTAKRPISDEEYQRALEIISAVDREKLKQEKTDWGTGAELLNPLTVEQLLATDNLLYRSYLAMFARILEAERGCDTPVEEFITQLVMSYGYGHAITPDTVIAEVDGAFRTNFDSAIEIARMMMKKYPKLLASEGEAA